MTPEKRILAFNEQAARQLLVALHEATQGKPFRDIILDEYNQITPNLAQSIYLTICVLNRFNIPVRAGLISRIYGISFDEFRKKFFAPLEHVVRSEENRLVGDFVYTARHSEIAYMVFEQVLFNPEKKFGEYVKILGGLNISYSTDLQSFRRLIRGKNLLENFPDHTAVVEIFKLAYKIEPNDAYVLQQNGIYEMRRPNGNLENARKLFNEARDLNRKDLTIVHSIAELTFAQSEQVVDLVEKEKYRKEAETALFSLLEDKDTKKYARHTLIKIELSRLTEELADDSTNESDIQRSIQSIEELISKGSIEEPDDSFLLSIEADFQDLIKNKEKALKALEKAFEVNKRDSYIATRLAKYYHSINDLNKAIEIVITALESNPNNTKLHYQLLMLYQEKGNPDVNTMIHHARHSFTPGGSSYNAQFWLAYYCFLSEETTNKKESRDLFQKLKEAYVPYEVRSKIRALLTENNHIKEFTGTLYRKESTYGFITRDGEGDQIFVHRSEVKDDWEALTSGKRLKFNIGFNFNGPTAIEVRVG